MRKIVAGAFAACLLMSASGARASDAVLAEALFREGRDAVTAGDFAKACPKFAESYRLDPAPGTLLNLGDCEERRGRLATAWEYFNRLYDTLAPNDDRRTLARTRADTVAARVPKLRVALDKDAPSGAQVLRDGKPLDAAALGTLVPIDPGAHVLVVRAPDHADSKTELKLAEGEKRDVTLKAGAYVPPPVAPPPVAPPEHRGLGGTRVAGIVVAGLGVLALGAGGITGGIALGTESQSKQYCSGNACFDPRGVDLHESARTQAFVADICFGVGAVAVVAGAVLWFAGKPHQARVGLAPAPSGLVLGGAF